MALQSVAKVTRGIAKAWALARPWPVTLREEGPAGVVVLRPLQRRDAHAWMLLRAQNADWLGPWEATPPRRETGLLPTFGEYVRMLAAQGRKGQTLPFAVELNGELVGQLTVSSITFGSLWGGSIGYWVSEHVAGRGVTPTGVAMAVDYCFSVIGLHRIEINIRPENRPSLRVVEKLGFRDEGIRERYLNIGGVWADHRTFALTAEEVPEGLLARWRAVQAGVRTAAVESADSVGSADPGSRSVPAFTAVFRTNGTYNMNDDAAGVSGGNQAGTVRREASGS